MKTYIAILIAGLLCGCQYPKQKPLEKEAQAQPLIPYVEDVELAKLILSPPRKELKITRDPFKPLITKDLPMRVAQASLINGDPAAATLSLENLDVAFVGVVHMDNEFVAYLQTPVKKGAFKVGDKIGSYTIERIDMDQIVFKSGENEITKKRGKT